MTDIHAFDQLCAGADDYLDRFVAKYREVTANVGDTENLRNLRTTLLDFETHELAPLLAAAIRRLARQQGNT